MPTLKHAICDLTVPAALSPTGCAIAVGDSVEYSRIIFSNGEHHLVLANNRSVPAIFFDI